MTHDEYKQSVEKDREYVLGRRDYWAAKKNEAVDAEARWQKQVDAIAMVAYRLENLDEKSAFGPAGSHS